MAVSVSSLQSDPVRPIAPRRIALVLAVCVSDLLLTGLVFGWAPLLLLLEEEDQYAELCPVASETMCSAQENRLNLMFAVASIAMNAGALPVGLVLDRVGPCVSTAVAAFVEVSGLSFLALSDSKTFDMFVPAYALVAFGGCITMMASFPASFLIMRHQTAILAAISCLFDGSSAIFLVLYAAHEQYGWSRKTLFLAFAVLAAVIYLGLIILWRLNANSLPPRRGRRIDANEENVSTTSPHEQQQLLLASGTVGTDSYDSVEAERSGIPAATTTRGNCDDAVFSLVDTALTEQLQSVEFAFIVAFAALQVLRATIYIGTTNKLLENLGDRAHGYVYTKVFSFVLPMGFVFVPSIDYVVESRGLPQALLLTNLLGVLYNVLELVPSLLMQCLTFVVFTAFRAFLYATISAFTAKTFGRTTMGSLMGIIFSIGSIVSLAEYPAVYVSTSMFHGDLTALTALSLVLCVLLTLWTMYLHKYQLSR
ncbi:unnamed protein product [Hyaloperonospora brassicae]|uniref:Major facilitator superfamily (MFS) profile domain-containing protein n=1 Tax=Hyaloperonospora brassicae TaxID=162125 RepID=A0AAV0TC25_HYABA|nr:unnamed protein product [Hyaloperonospora brassicae]